MSLNFNENESWIHSISAGEGSQSRAEVDEIGNILNTFIKHTLEVEAEAFEQTWDKITTAACGSNMLSTLAERLHVDAFFQFGQFLLLESEKKATPGIKTAIGHYLNFFRQPVFLKRIYGQKRWEPLILSLIQAADFTVGALFRQRRAQYGRKPLFNLIHPHSITAYSWEECQEKIDRFKKGLAALLWQEDHFDKVAFLTENSLDMALLDLACLTSGMVNVMIPANSVPQHIAYILGQTRARVLLVADDKQLAKVKTIKDKVPDLEQVVLLRGSSIEPWVMPLGEMVKAGNNVDDSLFDLRGKQLKSDHLATIMYTSGTTGDPKGIMFSHTNLVYKRFCRAMALPDIGSGDRLLAYLPLFHTFGRYLEMLGSVFWGAEYFFMENPALETMLDNMKRVQPTIFISIPKKWYQLYNHIKTKIDLEFDPPEKIRKTFQRESGGKLRWGLSAAGFLEPEVFKTFQANGIELMSGFGMTEATGGITMTPPGRYKENSLGTALPGIEIRLAGDGEMLIRGGYVMMRYYEGDDSVPADTHSWLPTGDVMQMDEEKNYFIIDRKKEIYKNIKGETIAPQKIENYFRDFKLIRQVFLVGDHRQFNSLLIYPNREDEQYQNMDDNTRHDYFASVVVTVNNFLAPFERIVDFREIERPFSEAEGELTPKGTYKRRVIEKHFDAVINEMYHKNYISEQCCGYEIRLPNWFLREKGCLTGDVLVNRNGISIPKYKQKLNLKFPKKERVRIGDYYFTCRGERLDFQIILANPVYWLGNKGIVDFAGETIYQWYRLDTPGLAITFADVARRPKIRRDEQSRFQAIFEGGEYSLEGLHLAAIHLQSPQEDHYNRACDYLGFILEDDSQPLFNLARELTRRPALVSVSAARARLFLTGIRYHRPEEFPGVLYDYLKTDPHLLEDTEMMARFIESARGDAYVDGVYRVLKRLVRELPDANIFEESAVPSLLTILAEYGIKHPTKYKKVRQMIVRFQLMDKSAPRLSRRARQARIRLLKGFRQWLGDNQAVAVDVETGEEYQWQDVITFEETISEEDRQHLLRAIEQTSLVREAIFLLSGGSMVRLYDIPTGGMWISLIEENARSRQFRLAIQTRYQGAYDITLCLDRTTPPPRLRNEINWLVHIGAVKKGEFLVDSFGGYWAEWHLWTKAYSANISVERFIQRQLRRGRSQNEKRVYHFWPFVVWSAAWAHVQFWKRSYFTLSVRDKSAGNIVIPSHDYQTGIKLISISERKATTSLTTLLKEFHKEFVKATTDTFPILKQGPMWDYLFAAVIDCFGEEKGLERLESIAREDKGKSTFSRHLRGFILHMKEQGYIPKMLYFATRRFQRWLQLNHEASLSAQARTLNELYVTYRLDELETRHPETRTKFFLNTVFAQSSPELKKALAQLIRKIHAENYSADEIVKQVSLLEKSLKLSENEAYFLTRLSYPHLKPSDMAEFVNLQHGGKMHADVVVHLEDYDGETYMVRRPVTPKEISRLHQIFIEAQMPVSFRPDHQFMVAVSQRGHIIGGLFYNYIDAKTVYMEKIVVADRYRRKGISEGLMYEFFNRLRGEHVNTVTTGFLRPEYFYRFGFKVERKYSGLVKDLTKNEERGIETIAQASDYDGA
ncbi:MAG TPA: GNAT family N-acetyltransferase [Caldithrix abyssi]|uniref:GNAT family N-acetyltransferase n=1 Tax=Caldithrix abyssi TaxID=187145 RepID=A0A7V1PTL3_CALAY|nr:GNAT family N-acetyltransferase [Caldithrix abyssi]